METLSLKRREARLDRGLENSPEPLSHRCPGAGEKDDGRMEVRFGSLLFQNPIILALPHKKTEGSETFY